MSGIKPTKPQDYLLSINLNDNPIIENALPGVHALPLMIDIEGGVFAIYLRLEPGAILAKHFHSGPVHFYTTTGKWHYAEYPDDMQTAGSYLYEPAGSVHTLICPADSTECAEGFIVNFGANIEFDDDGNFLHIVDAGMIEQLAINACNRQGRAMPRYIRKNGGADFAGG